jgi:ribonuclease T1
VFTDAERILPRQAAGYYRECTVRTRNSSNRGSRRLALCRGGDICCTRDHYASFRPMPR